MCDQPSVHAYLQQDRVSASHSRLEGSHLWARRPQAIRHDAPSRADALLEKPFTPEHLADAIGKVLADSPAARTNY